MGKEGAATMAPGPESVPVDRWAVLAVLVGAWWAVWALECLEGAAHRRTLEGLAGPDWDIRYPGAAAHSAAHSSAHSSGPASPSPPPEPYPRQLRQARGLGRARSLDLTRYYAQMGADAPADVLRGIGKSTALAARDAVERLRADYRDWARSPSFPKDP